MEVDPEEVKRHLDILGYTHLEPSLLNEFVEDLKKIIDYDQRHNNISVQSTSLQNKDWPDQSYSERMQSSTPNKTSTSIGRSRTANGDERESHPIARSINQNGALITSPKMMDMHNKTSMNKSSKCETESMQPKCYFCGSIPMENQQTTKVKRRSNPLHTIHLSVTFGIEL